MSLCESILDVTRESSLNWDTQFEQSKDKEFLLLLDPMSSSLKKQVEQLFAIKELNKALMKNFTKQKAIITLFSVDEAFLSKLDEKVCQHIEAMIAELSNAELRYRMDLPFEQMLDHIATLFTRPFSQITPIFSSHVPFEISNGKSSKAILLVGELSLTQNMKELCRHFHTEGKKLRCIEACYFSDSWEELDTVYYDSSIIDELIERQLLGFEAAGGKLQDLFC